MRTKTWLWAGVLAALPFAMGAGCPYNSPFPAGPLERFEPPLVGLWERVDGDETLFVEIARTADGGVDVRLPNEANDGWFRGHASVVGGPGGARYLSLQAVPMPGEEAPAAAGEEPPHFTLVRYEVTVETLTLRVVEDALFKARPEPVDSQEALQSFLLEHAENPDLYGDALVMRRVPANSADAAKRIDRLERRIKTLEAKLDEALELLRGKGEEHHEGDEEGQGHGEGAPMEDAPGAAPPTEVPPGEVPPGEAPPSED